MKKVLLVILFFVCLFTQGQDPSFSQSDLNMIYTNPAFSGYEGKTKILSNTRMQWTELNENFNTNIIEFNLSLRLNPNNRKTKTTWAPGIGVIGQDIGLILEGNKVWIDKTEVMISPATFHMKSGKNWYLSGGASGTWKQYSLSTKSLIFSDQWSQFGQYNNSLHFTLNSSSGSFNPLHTFDMSVGGIITRQGRYQSNRGNRFLLGQSLHHIIPSNEKFWSPAIDDNKVPLKHITHAEWFYGFPKYQRSFIAYTKSFLIHERYINKVNEAFIPRYWNESLISKTEFGTTAFINRTPIEIGLLFRRIHQNEDTIRLFDEYKFQSLVPIMRYRLPNSRNLWIISYSMDINIASSDGLDFSNTLWTHEFGISIYLDAGNQKNKECPAYGDMKNNALYQDIMNHGLLNKRTPKGNFK